MEDPADAPPADAGDLDSEEANGAAEPFDSLGAMMEVDPEGAAQLQADWGDDFDHNLSLARQAATVFGDPALRAALEESGLGDDPRVVRVAAEIGRMLQRRAHSGPENASPDNGQLEARLKEFGNRDDYWSPDVQREVRQIYLALHGNRPLPTHRDAGDAGGGAW